MKTTLGLMAALAACAAAAQGQQADSSKVDTAQVLQGAAPAAPAWVPFAVERDIESGSALDFSRFAAAHAPCGVHGRVVTRGDHFELEGRPGEAMRFWGVNICQKANFPDEDKVDAAVAHLARVGYNSVRLHHHDDGLVAYNPDAFGPGGAGLDPGALRRMDALIAACGRHGLYVITDIYVSRSVSWRSCGIDRDGTMGKGQFKHLVPVHDGAFANWCAFASAWLGHTNVFTGVRLADDPALIAVALINEGNLDNGAGPEPFVSLPNWQEKWEAWLAAKKAADAAFSGIPATIPDGNHWSRTRHVAAFSRFLADVEADFEARAVRFLREEVGLKAPISNMSAWMQPPEYQSILAGPTQDYVEMHSYCDHPTWVGGAWGLPCRVGRENPVRQRTHSMESGAMGGTLKRIFGKPFCVTEFNYCGPNPHRGAGGLLFGAECAAQDWSGAWRFCWSHSKNGIEAPGTGTMGLFDMSCDPLRTASERIADMLFLRGDLAPNQDAYAVWLPPSKIAGTFDGESCQLNTPWPELAWRARLGTVWSEEPPEWARWVDPYPDYYKRKPPVADDIPQRAMPVADDIPQRGDIVLDREAGWFKVATPRTCAVFAEGGEHVAGAVKFEILPSNQSSANQSGAPLSATIWASSLDGAPLAESRHILVGMLTDLRNTDMVTEEGGVGTSSLSGGPTTIVKKWGTLPYLVRAGHARVELATTPGAWHCWALSQGGRRRFEVPVNLAENGEARNGAGAQGGTGEAQNTAASPASASGGARCNTAHIAFTADTAADPSAATFFWELAK